MVCITASANDPNCRINCVNTCDNWNDADVGVDADDVNDRAIFIMGDTASHMLTTEMLATRLGD